MLKRNRKNQAFKQVTITLVVCLFVAAKLKLPLASPLVKKAPQKQLVQEQVLVAEAPEGFVPPSLPEIPDLPLLPQISAHKSPAPVKRQVRQHKRNKQDQFYVAAIQVTLQQIQEEQLSQVATVGLEEAPQGEVFRLDPFESETTLDPAFALYSSIPREMPVSVYEGVLVANDFTPLHQALKELSEVPELREEIVAPVSAPSTDTQFAQETSAQDETEQLNIQVAVPQPDETREDLPQQTQADALPEEEPTPVAEVPTQDEPSLNPVEAAPTSISDFKELIQQGQDFLKSIQNFAAPQIPAQVPVTTQTLQEKNSNQNIVPGVESQLRSTEPLGKVFGKLTLDRKLQDWINQSQGHIELHLQKAGSREPQDAIFIDYRYPEKDFEIDARDFQGGYELVASFFKPDTPIALAQVTYPKILNEVTTREMIVFHLKKDHVDGAMRSETHIKKDVILSGTVFEASAGDHRNVKVIRGAEIEVVGQPQWGTFRSDSEGNFRIPSMPTSSEVLLSVKAPGYYPTQTIVPTFQTTGYVSLHLVPKSNVDTITNYFTKLPQQDSKAVILGRIFNPDSRVPQADAEVFLSGRNGRALYFNVFPDKQLRQTSANGLFAFFNVEPAFRSVAKAKSAAFELIEALPGSAYYLELGRGGKKSLRGTLFDPYKQQRLIGLVRVVGANAQVTTNELGEFQLDGIEAPPGVLTLEVESQGYPTSWFTVAWSARETKRNHLLYLVEKDLLDEVRESMAKLSSNPAKGQILGGAESRFFDNMQSCVYVSLENIKGETLSAEHGPFPVHFGDVPSKQPLCLSKQRPGFSFFNLEPGQYILKWTNSKGELLRSHITRVGSDRASILVN